MSLEVRGISDLFPTPEYLLLSRAGLAISDEGVKFLELKKSLLGKSVAVARHRSIPLPTHSIESGFVNNPEALKKALQEISGLGARYVHATLPEERAYLFTAIIDRVPPESIRDSIAFILEENVPLTLSGSVFDFDVVGEPGPDKLKVTVSVLSKKVVDFYVETLEAVGLTPVSFDIESQAISRAVIREGDTSTQLILSLRPTKTGLYIVEDEVVQFTTTLPFSAKSHLEELKNEVEKIFSFWGKRLDHTNGIEDKIQRILLSGTETLEESFVAELSKSAKVPVLASDPWSSVADSLGSLPEEISKNPLGYAAVIGSALATTRGRLSKLLPQEERQKVDNEYRVRRVVLALSSVALALLVGLVGILPSLMLAENRIREIVEQNEMQSLDSQLAERDELLAWLNDVEEKLGVLSLATGDTKPSLPLLKLVERRQGEVKLTRIEWSPTALSLAGIALSRQALLSFETTLNDSGDYEKVALPLSSLTRERNVDFEMKLIPRVKP